jgi:L-fuconate dehydratase
MFKQFFQADAIDFCQLDTERLGSLNEIVAVLLLAAKFNVPVCPHAGGVGLCEMVRHVSVLDYVAVSGDLTNRVTEFVDQPARALHRPVCRARRRRGDRVRPSLRAGLLHADARGIRRAVPVPDGRYWAEARTRARSRRPSQELSLAKVVLR